MPRRRLTVSRQFSSAVERLRWADEQILELKARSHRFFAHTQLNKRFSEIDPKTGHTIDIIPLGGPLPSPVVRNAVQIIESLRSALDHGACATVRGSGKKSTYFPFGDTKRDMKAAIKGSRGKHLPHQIASLFTSFKPYKSGNPPLWALNKICNTAKHRTIVQPGIDFKDVVFEDYWRVGEPDGVITPRPIWNARKHQIEISRATGKGTIHHDVEFGMSVAFGKVPVFRGLPVLPVLRYLSSMVERILWATETEARRIGIIK